MFAFPGFQLKDHSLLKRDCYVNGAWVRAQRSKVFIVSDPASGCNIVECPEFDREDTLQAVDAAQKALVSFRHTTPRQRAGWLRKWSDLMLANIDDLANIITLENGKPLAEVRGEVVYAASFLQWFSEEAARIYGETITSSNPIHRIITVKQPVGVCALIAPWNFPAAMITRKVGPALAAGCTMVVKAPAHRSGIPPGVVNVITALDNTAEVGQVLTTSTTIKKVPFTGSTMVGKLLMAQSSTTLKKLSLELGGNAPFIVFEDADLDAAVAGLIASKFRNAGQTCVCANRIFVHRDVHEAFVSRLLTAVKKFKVGNGFDENVTHGPLVHQKAVKKVESHIADALNKGAFLVHGGRPLTHLGINFFDITIMTGMKSGMQVCDEETFGPLAAIFAFDSEQEVIELANDSEVGLGGYFFSKSVSRCWRVAEALEVGMVGVNTGVISDTAAPFGGIKQSGFGREGSKYGIDEFVITKMITTAVDF